MSIEPESEQFLNPNPLAPGQTPAGKGSQKWIGAAAAAAVVVILTVGGGAYVKVMGGGGPQPEDVLPANAIAFAKLDLNPAAGQKLAAYQLISKFPAAKSKVNSEDSSIKELTFGSIFTGDSGLGLDYKTDVAPWLGDRVGIGVFPDLDADKKPEIGLAIAFNDQDAARTALDKAVKKGVKKGGTKGRFGYAFADDYVIVSDNDAHAVALVQAGKVNALAGSTYAEDVKKLGSDQIGVAWVDIAAASKAAVKSRLPKSTIGMLKKAGKSKVSGRTVVGLHADSSFLELSAMGIDLKGADAVVNVDAGADAALIESFPSQVFAAFTVHGLGKSLGSVFTSLTAKSDPMQIRSRLSAMGLDSAKKVETMLGAETGLLVGGNAAQPQFAIRTRGGNPTAALATARRTLAGVPVKGGLQIRKISGPPGIVVGTRPTGPGFDLTSAILSRSGSKLGSADVFRQVIPQNEKADFVAFVNLSKVLPLLSKDPGSRAHLASLKPLRAIGLTATGGTRPFVRLRLSIR